MIRSPIDTDSGVHATAVIVQTETFGPDVNEATLVEMIMIASWR